MKSNMRGFLLVQVIAPAGKSSGDGKKDQGDDDIKQIGHCCSLRFIKLIHPNVS